MAAFRAAIAAGHGIECDVRASADGQAIVFHDADLQRMTSHDARVNELPASELMALALPDGGHIPSLGALLTLCGDRTPVLVEIKARDAHGSTICKAVAHDLAAHPAAQAAIMSFSPMIVRWFRRHHPDVPRGLVVSRQGKGLGRSSIERALALWLAKPDFLACDICDLPTPFAARARSRGMPVLSWTIRKEEERRRAMAHADQIIYEDAGAPHG